MRAQPASLFSKLSDPTRWRSFFKDFPLRLGRFNLGLWSIGPGTCVIYRPARYSMFNDKYIERTGRNIFQDIKKFFGNQASHKGDITRYFFLNLVIDQLVKDGLKGDFAELGVYKGNTGFLFADAARRLGRNAYLFDTFAGFDKSDLKDVDADKASKDRFDDTSLATVKSLVGEQNVRFVQGYFPQSTSLVPDDLSFCLVHLDCDLYAPFRAALEYFYDRLVPGGFLIMHDYSSLEWAGVEKAVDEFFANKPETVIPIPDTWGTAVIRKV